MSSDLQKAVFLDRDGTLIEDRGYLVDPAQIVILPGVPQGLCRLRESGWLCIVVTNQSAIGRGMLTHERLEEIHRVMKSRLQEQRGSIDAIYYAPDAPGAGMHAAQFPDRKPEPGMLIRAARDWGIDLSRSWMIGDSLRDVQAGQHAGCLGSILVETGNPVCEEGRKAATQVVQNFSQAVDAVLAAPEAPFS